MKYQTARIGFIEGKITCSSTLWGLWIDSSHNVSPELCFCLQLLCCNRHSYQLIQIGIIYTVYKIALVPVSIGKLYHWIRGQSMIKLYVLIAIVEVFDRLLCSLGQDCLDSLYWNTTRRPRSECSLYHVVEFWLAWIFLFTNVA